MPKKKTSSGFQFVSGLADGASAMLAKWNRPVFSFRFYEGKISTGNLRPVQLLLGHTKIDDAIAIEEQVDCLKYRGRAAALRPRRPVTTGK
jgi:hypothetical protein